MPEYGLGRVPEFDERSRNYPVRRFLKRQGVDNRLWPCETVLDQGPDGACVGFSWSHELACEPEVHQVDYANAMMLYHRAQQLDEWPGENYDGSSVLAGAKAVSELGFLTEYRWAFGAQDVLDTLSQFGPVVLGINWYDSMFNPGVDYLLRVEGNIAGGHAILCRGVSEMRETVLLHNSWGPDWGSNGCANLSWDDLDRLLREEGEACVPVTRTQVIEPVPVPVPVPPTPSKPAGCLSRQGLRRLIQSGR